MRNGKYSKEGWATYASQQDYTTHYRNGKLDGFYRMESTRDGKPYITIEGQYTDGEKSGRWKQYNITR
ncbi:hypothetical protein NXW96_22170 [Bacteroides fragilis]|nr:hypothetical protein [Bacteroides fragilis]